MTVLLLSVVGGLFAFELWGSIDLMAKLAIRGLTAPLAEPWRKTRRAELASLIRPCRGERRIVALIRVIATAGVLAGSDLRSWRLRLPNPHVAFGQRAQEFFIDEMMINETTVFYLGGSAIVGASMVSSLALALMLGVKTWQLAIFWLTAVAAAFAAWALVIQFPARVNPLCALPLFVFRLAAGGLLVSAAVLTRPFRVSRRS